MRKLNVFLVAGIFITFIIHALMASLRLFGAETDTVKIIAFICAGLICAHVAVTVILTVQTLHARKKSGAGYFRSNLMFWARRISGLTILIPLLMHIFIFSGTGDDAFRLVTFTTGRFISQIFLVVTIAFHGLINIRPLMISLGAKSPKLFSADLIFIISVILLIAAAAFSFYYLRWTSI